MKKQRLTVGHRARILPPKSNNKDNLQCHDGFWRKTYAGHEILLLERVHGAGEFSVMVLKKGTNVLLKKRNGSIVEDQVAWVPETDLELVDTNLEANLNFIDWYQLNEDKFCPDCGRWFPNNGLQGHSCPNKKCPSYSK